MLPNKKAASSLADPTEYENLFPGFADTVKCEQFLKLQRMKRFPASTYPQVPVRFNAFLSYWSLSNKSTYCCKSVQTIFEPNTHVLNVGLLCTFPTDTYTFFWPSIYELQKDLQNPGPSVHHSGRWYSRQRLHFEVRSHYISRLNSFKDFIS